MGNDVTFDLKLAVNDFNKNLKKVDNNIGKFHTDFKKQTNKSSAAWSSFAGNLGANAVAFAAKGLGNLIGKMGSLAQESIKLASIQEEAINDLNVALKGTGTFTDKASKDFQKFASSLQETSIFGDEAILKTAALGVQMGKLSGQDLKDATLAAADMASALNVDLNTAMRLIAKSATDSGTGLKRYGVLVEQGKTSSESMANAIKAVNNQFGGAAAGKVNTYSGALQQASNSYGDMLEEIGFVITKSPVLVNIIKATGKQFSVLGKYITENMTSIRSFVANGIIKLLDGFKYIIEYINPVVKAFQIMGSVFNIVQNSLTAGITSIGLLFSKMSLDIITELSNVVNAFPDALVPDGWKESLNSAKESLQETTTSMVDSIVVDSEDMKASIKSIGDSFNNDIISEESIGLMKEKLTSFQTIIKESNTSILTENEKKDKKELDLIAKRDKKELEFKKVKTKEEIALEKQAAAEQEKIRALALKDKQTKATISQNIIAAAQVFAKKESVVAKGLAISSSMINTYMAATAALAPPPIGAGPLLGPILAGSIIGLGTANVAKIAGVGNYENGGFIPGNSFSGDNLQANVNSGEAVLNTSQQKNFMDMANGTSGNGDMVSAINSLGDRIANMEIVIMADDNEIARSTSRGVEQGIIIGRS